MTGRSQPAAGRRGSAARRPHRSSRHRVRLHQSPAEWTGSRTATEAIKGFVSAYIFQLGLVELQDQIINGTLDGNEAVVRERMLRGWIDAKVRSLDIDASPALSANALHQAAADLAQRAVRVLRAR